jgi:hypothetical protein
MLDRLFGLVISDADNKFYNIDTRSLQELRGIEDKKLLSGIFITITFFLS